MLMCARKMAEDATCSQVFSPGTSTGRKTIWHLLTQVQLENGNLHVDLSKAQ